LEGVLQFTPSIILNFDIEKFHILKILIKLRHKTIDPFSHKYHSVIHGRPKCFVENETSFSLFRHVSKDRRNGQKLASADH